MFFKLANNVYFIEKCNLLNYFVICFSLAMVVSFILFFKLAKDVYFISKLNCLITLVKGCLFYFKIKLLNYIGKRMFILLKSDIDYLNV